MTKLNEISELLKQAEAKVESLKAEMQATTIALPEYDPTWKPEEGEGYFFISDDRRGIYSLRNRNEINTYRLHCNNIFKTEKELELYLKIFNRIHELNEKDPLDWGNEEKTYHFYYHFGEEAVHTSADYACKSQGTTYMTKATMAKIRSEFTDKELEVWVRR